MIEFPAIWIWYGFLVLGGLLSAIALAQVFNSFRHGAHLPLTVLNGAIFVVGVGAIFAAAMSQLSSVDWTSTLTLTLPNMDWLRFGN